MILPMAETLRIVRHGVTPLVILAVERGWLPAAAKSDTVEFIAIALSFAIVYGWSWYHERRSRSDSMDSEHAGGSVGAGGAGGSGDVETPRQAAEEQGA